MPQTLRGFWRFCDLFPVPNKTTQRHRSADKQKDWSRLDKIILTAAFDLFVLRTERGVERRRRMEKWERTAEDKTIVEMLTADFLNHQHPD